MASIVAQLAPLWQRLEQERGLPLGFMDRMAKVESSYNPNARNPRSSAGGLFQFIDSTARNYGLEDKFDPVASSEAAARLAFDNAAYLRKNGIEPTAGNLYLAHQQGPAGAVKLLRGGAAPASSVVGGAEAGLNGGGGLSASAMANKWTSKFADIDGTASPSPFAPPKENTEMAAPNPAADMPAPGAVETQSQYATAAPSWGQSDNDQLMMALALIANAIPNGQVAKDPGSVIKPWMDMRARREDRAYLRSKDERDFALRKDEIDRAQRNWDASFGLQKSAADRAAAAEARADAKPLIQQFKDTAGNTVYKQWDNNSRTWNDLPSAAPAPSPVTSAPLAPPPMGETQGPPIPADLMPQAAPTSTAPSASAIPPPPPGVNVEAWYKAHTEDQAKRSLPPSSEDATSLRKEIQGLPSYKNMSQAAPIYRSMAEAAGRNTKAADLNLVYGLGKIFDPGSVVREGEMVMVKNTSSLPDWLQSVIGQINGGAALTPETRERIMQEAYGRMQGYQGQYDQDIQQYRGIVDRRRMNADDVIFNFGKFEPWKAPATGATPGATTGTASPQNDGATRKVIGGKTYVRPKNSSSWFEE